MDSVFDTGAFAPCPAPFNLAGHVLAHAKDLADKTALSVIAPGKHAQSWTYGQMAAAVRGTGTGLLQAGFAPGDIVLMRLGNTVEFPIAYLGAIAAGIIPVPTSSQLTAPEVAKMVQQLRPAGILHDAEVACPMDTGLPIIDTATLEQMRSLPPCDFAMGDPNRLAYIIYTSGTSGNPRAVMHAHRAIWARKMMHQGWYGLGQNDRLLHAGAFNWTFTLGTGLMDPWTVGATALIPAQGTDPADLPQLLAEHEATIFAAAPGVYRKLFTQIAKPDLPRLRHGLAAGEKLSDSIRAHWTEATGTPIFEAYGMSECSTFISSSPLHPAQDGMLGHPQDGRRVAIVDASGTPVPMGQPGTIAVDRADPGLMLGYLGAEEETAAKMCGPWFLTGDQGIMHPSGQIAYEGRDDDMMNAGGYRVSPLEVETALLAHPDVLEAGVTDLEIKQDVRVIAAFYTSAEDIPDDALAQHCADRLARYKQPRLFFRLDTLPTNPNGKLSRKALRNRTV